MFLKGNHSISFTYIFSKEFISYRKIIILYLFLISGYGFSQCNWGFDMSKTGPYCPVSENIDLTAWDTTKTGGCVIEPGFVFIIKLDAYSQTDDYIDFYKNGAFFQKFNYANFPSTFLNNTWLIIYADYRNPADVYSFKFCDSYNDGTFVYRIFDRATNILLKSGTINGSAGCTTVTIPKVYGIATFSGPGVTNNSNGFGTFNPGKAGPGTHVITYTFDNEKGFKGSVTKTVVVRNKPPVTVNSTTILPGCNAVLTATGATTYKWNSGSSANPITVSPNTTTSYTVTGTDGFGCKASDTAVVIVANNFTINVNSPTVCKGDAVTLTANGADNYVWNTGDKTQSITVTPNATITYTVTGTLTSCPAAPATAVSTVTVLPKPTVTVNNASVCSGVAAKLTASGATSFKWSTGETTASINVTPATTTTYTVTGTNANGCSDVKQAVVTVQPPVPAPNVSSNSPVCAGATLNLFASEADPSITKFTWTGPNGFNSILQNPSINKVTLNAAGTYSVFATSNNCNSPTATIQIIVNPNPSNFLPADTSICNDTSFVAKTKSAFVSYKWQDGSVKNTFTVKTAGLYWLKVTDANGCSATDTLNVTMKQIPVVTVNDASVCNGVAATLNASGANKYKWNTGQTTATISVNPVTTTTYTVTGTGVSGCWNIKTAVVTVQAAIPAPNLTSNSPVCEGSSLNLFASEGDPTINKFTWTGPNGFNSKLQNPVINNVTLNAAGTYSAYASVNSCNSPVSTINITVNTVPANFLQADTSICNDGAFVAKVKSAFVNYKWQDGSTNNFYNVNTIGKYWLNVTDANGCSGTDTLKVSLKQIPVVTVNDASVCNGVSATLNASGANKYIWNTGQTTLSITVNPLTTTTYSVTGTGISGCKDIKTAVVTVHGIVTAPVLSSNSPVCEGSTLNLTATDSDPTITQFSWTGPNGFNSQLQNPVINNVKVNAGGTYSAYASLDQCKSTVVTINVIINSNPSNFLPADTSICNDTSFVARSKSAFVNYKWQDGSTNDSYRVTAIGKYWLNVTDANGCSGADTLKVTLKQLPVVDVKDASVCYGLAASLNATGANKYLWNTGETSASISVNPKITTTYSVTGTANSGCWDIKYAVVTVHDSVRTPVLSSNSPVCVGTDLNLTATDADPSVNQFSWSGPNGFKSQLQNPVINNVKINAGGTYTAFATLDNCKSKTATIDVIINPIPASFLPPDFAVCNDSSYTIQSTGNYTSYLWQDNSANSSFVVDTVGVYWLRVTDANGCVGTDTLHVIYNCPPVIFIPNAFNPSPKGINKTFAPQAPIGVITKFSMDIFNRYGMLLYHTDNIYKGWDGTFNGVLCPFGIYVYKIQYQGLDNEHIVRRVAYGKLTLLR